MDSPTEGHFMSGPLGPQEKVNFTRLHDRTAVKRGAEIDLPSLLDSGFLGSVIRRLSVYTVHHMEKVALWVVLNVARSIEPNPI